MRRRMALALTAVFVGAAAVAGYAVLRPQPAAAREIVVYASPDCGCCHGWVSYLRRHDIGVVVKLEEDVYPTKDRLAVPDDLRSCHTAEIEGYVVEGHVPLEAIEKLLRERPKIAGIASPGMPSGAPGMDGPKEPNPIVGFGGGVTTPLGVY